MGGKNIFYGTHDKHLSGRNPFGHHSHQISIVADFFRRRFIFCYRRQVKPDIPVGIGVEGGYVFVAGKSSIQMLEKPLNGGIAKNEVLHFYLIFYQFGNICIF